MKLKPWTPLLAAMFTMQPVEAAAHPVVGGSGELRVAARSFLHQRYTRFRLSLRLTAGWGMLPRT
jgi:hypothetical protein